MCRMTWRAKRDGERGASACIRRHQAFALAPVNVAGNICEALSHGSRDAAARVARLPCGGGEVR